MSMKKIVPIVCCASVWVTSLGLSIVEAQSGQGSIVGWGSQVIGGDLSKSFIGFTAAIRSWLRQEGWEPTTRIEQFQ